MQKRKVSKKFLVFFLIASWIFTGWPQFMGFPPDVEVAKAANTPGDYMIRRNDAETTSITTSNLDATWDTQVASSGSSISYSAGTFTLASGKYLVMYSERFHSDDINNNRRNEIQGRLVIGGTATTTASGQAYMRKQDTSGDDWQRDGIVHGAGIIHVPSDSTSLVTRFYRTDNASDAGGTTDRYPDWGGVTILALDDSWDYARYSRNTTLNPAPDAWGDFIWQDTDEEETGFSGSGAAITITSAGRYLVTYSIPISKSTGTGGAARTEVLTRLTLDGAEVEGTEVSTYIRGNESTDNGVITYAGIIDVAASDVLNVDMDLIDGTASALTIDANANIQILKLPAGNETIIVEATSGEMNPLDMTEFAWDSTAHIDAAAFTMAAGTDSYFDVDVADDYLFFAAHQTGNGNVRTYATGRFSVNNATSTHMSAGEYNRSSGADQAGYAFGSLITGLSAGDDISLENIHIEFGRLSQTVAHGAMSGLRLGSIFSAPGSFSVDIVNSGGTPVASPSVILGAQAFSFARTTTTGILGTNDERIRVDNGTATPNWSLTLAATSGSTSVWDTGSITYDYNDPTSGGGDGGDADLVGGQLIIDSSGGTISPQGGCSTTGVSLSSETAYSEGVIDSITLGSADGTADTNCYWDITGIDLSQEIPAEQSVGTYTLDFTLTIS